MRPSLILIWVIGGSLVFFGTFNRSLPLAKEADKYGGTHKVAPERDPKSLGPRYLGKQPTATQIQMQIFERMVDHSKERPKQVIPLIAASWKQKF